MASSHTYVYMFYFNCIQIAFIQLMKVTRPNNLLMIKVKNESIIVIIIIIISGIIIGERVK